MSKAPFPTLLTKHCTPAVRKFMLDGRFKIGTLREFRACELATGAFSDAGEGTSVIAIKGDVRNASFSIGNNVFSNNTFIGNGTAIVVSHELDANAFCASTGPYNTKRHEILMGETAGYKGNPEWTAHLILNTERLIGALKALQASAARPTILGCGPIRYDKRELEGVQFDIPALINDQRRLQHALDCVFVKPKRFSIEEEFRIGLIPTTGGGPCDTLWTADSPGLMEMFRGAVEDEGSDQPR